MSREPVKVRSLFRGPLVWGGIVMAGIGLVAIDCGTANSGFGTMVLLGGFQLGLGVASNHFERLRAGE
ncbi:MAG: hypothetical protein KAI24_00385 [Planctomycetes bacterium]|nr:hypothetical protein [Planctomycetota bacterium]